MMGDFYNGAGGHAGPDPADASQWNGKGRGSKGKANGKADDKTSTGGQASDAPDTLPLLWLEDIQPVLEARDFVQGVLVEQGAAVLYGDSNAGKTFWATDLALHVAAGLSWNGRRVQQAGVIYCVLEGGDGFKNRVFAWKTAHKDELPEGTRIPFAAIPASINLLHPDADTPHLIKTVKAAQTQIDVPVKLIIIDTLARAMAGGNENGPDDMGLLIANMDDIRAETGASVLFIHHCGKDQAKGARGHSSLRAAIDTEIEVRADEEAGTRSATVVKQRDLPKGDVFGFSLECVVLGHNQYGEDVTTCIVKSATAADTRQTGAGGKLDPESFSLLKVIEAAIAKGLGRVESPEPEMLRCYCIDRTVLQKELIRDGWLMVSDRTATQPTGKDIHSDFAVSSEVFGRYSSDDGRSECVTKAEHTRLWKRLTTLKNKRKIGFNRDIVWLTKPVSTP